MKEESEKVGLKLNIQKTKIMATSPLTSRQKTRGKKAEAMTDFTSLSSKVTVDGDRSHEIKRHLLLGRKAMANRWKNNGNNDRIYFLGLQKRCEH